MLVPICIESKQQIYVLFVARLRLQERLLKLEFERHGVDIEEDNDFIHPT